MASYRYPLPRRYRARYRFRYRSQDSGGALPYIVAGAVLLAAGSGAGVKAVTRHAPASSAPVPAAGNRAAAQVLAFARSKVGVVPYVWGGTTDAGMDCSGLAQSAYASAGVSLERTSQQQWASERHVSGSKVVPGDLVFFAGSDGTLTAPGHVGIVVDTARHRMIDAYATGTLVRYDTYGLASSAPGLGTVVGFTDPAPASPVTAAAPAAGEAGFFAAVLAALGAPATKANLGSLAAWASHEGPWGTVGRWNPLDTTLYEPGSWAFNTLAGGGHVWNYPSAAEGVKATAATLLGGYPNIVSAFRHGRGVCGYGFAAELGKWSGAYTEVC